MTNLRSALKGAAIAVALAGTAIATTGTASAQSGYYGDYNRDGYYNSDPYSGYNRDRYDNGYTYDRYDNGRYGYGRNRGNGILSILLGDVAFGYRDGYWDRRHHWHHWRHNSDYRYYRDHGSNYYGWNHARDGTDGWQR